jgi:hypothetical protein
LNLLPSRGQPFALFFTVVIQPLVGSSGFGQLTQSFPARVLQFGGKFTF